MRSLCLAAAVAATLATAAPAAEVDVALLQSFAGQWNGTGTLDGKDGKSTFDCKLAVASGNRGKVVLRGTCAPLAFNGAMAFNGSTGRYEMALTSNANFAGSAGGRRDGDDLYFSLDDSAVNDKAESLKLKADLAMRGDVIIIGFDAVLNGDAYDGTLRFER